jgi:hypothetical protein
MVFEEFKCSTPEPGDPARYKGDDYKIVTIIDGSAWLTRDGENSVKAGPGEWEAVRKPRKGDIIMVSRNGSRYSPRFFFGFNYDRGGVFCCEDSICWNKWRFPTIDDFHAIYEDKEDQ